MRSQPEKASADFCKALALGDRDPRLLADVVASGEVLDRVLPLLPVNETTLLGRLLLSEQTALRGGVDWRKPRPSWSESSACTWKKTSVPHGEPARSPS